jgi:hypothetical protein
MFLPHSFIEHVFFGVYGEQFVFAKKQLHPIELSRTTGNNAERRVRIYKSPAETHQWMCRYDADTAGTINGLPPPSRDLRLRGHQPIYATLRESGSVNKPMNLNDTANMALKALGSAQ